MPIISTSRLITIDRHITEEEDRHPEATGAFSSILHDLTFAFRLIAREVRRAGLSDILGLTSNYNVHGEQVRKIDEYANEAIYKSMYRNLHIAAMVSEESEELLEIPKEFKRGKYILAFDPLDGSTNIDVNGVLGTIFSLLKRKSSDDTSDCCKEDVLQAGSKQVAAGYILYGSSTVLAYTTGSGVNIFTYDPTIGEFLLIDAGHKMPDFGKHYSCNEAYSLRWEPWVQEYLSFIKNTENGNTGYKSRYYATAVADIHRLLYTGGIYLYPKEPDKPEGKIRLLYEASPLSFIVEQAGGKGITGPDRILDVIPTNIHQTVPFFLGSRKNVEELENYYKKYH
jgi:fructose-1,6-bisphosphatase I